MKSALQTLIERGSPDEILAKLRRIRSANADRARRS